MFFRNVFVIVSSFAFGVNTRDLEMENAMNTYNLQDTEKIILKIIHKYHKRHIIPAQDDVRKEAKEEYQKKFKRILENVLFNGTIKSLIYQNLIKKEKASEAAPPYKKLIILRITTEGINRAIQEELSELAGKTERSITSALNYITETKNEVKDIKNDFQKLQSDFYGRLIQIFSIFVAIFSFILVGFTQIPILVGIERDFWANLSNVSAVFFPLTGVLIILLIATSIVIKYT